MLNSYRQLLPVLLLLLFLAVHPPLIFGKLVKQTKSDQRMRAREAGVEIGILRPGKFNAITDVPGVLVGHSTLIEADSIRTGVTAVLPHSGNLYREKVTAAIYVGNGFGKLVGATQVQELGELESPVLLTNTLNVPRVADALLDYMLRLPENAEVRSLNVVVGETNDGYLNDIRGRHLDKSHVMEALLDAKSGPVAEGSIGAGTGTVCLGFKGGIGSSSRLLPPVDGGYTVGVLVQSNFGGLLTINGAPIGRELQRFALQSHIPYPDGDGSIMIIVATDAPLSHRNLYRLAKRAMLGIARTGGFSSNGSGDYIIAFSTQRLQTTTEAGRTLEIRREIPNDAMSPLFLAVVEATEEAIINSLFMATTVSGRSKHTVEALPLTETLSLLQKYHALQQNQNLPSWLRK